jgi:hypothetical protein
LVYGLDKKKAQIQKNLLFYDLGDALLDILVSELGDESFSLLSN